MKHDLARAPGVISMTRRTKPGKAEAIRINVSIPIIFENLDPPGIDRMRLFQSRKEECLTFLWPGRARFYIPIILKLRNKTKPRPFKVLYSHYVGNQKIETSDHRRKFCIFIKCKILVIFRVDYWGFYLDPLFQVKFSSEGQRIGDVGSGVGWLGCGWRNMGRGPGGCLPELKYLYLACKLAHLRYDMICMRWLDLLWCPSAFARFWGPVFGVPVPDPYCFLF